MIDPEIPLMQIQSLFIHLHVVPNLLDLFSSVNVKYLILAALHHINDFTVEPNTLMSLT